MNLFEDIRAEEPGGTNATGIEAALMAIGQDFGLPRPPSAWPLTERQQLQMTAFLKTSNLI